MNIYKQVLMTTVTIIMLLSGQITQSAIPFEVGDVFVNRSAFATFSITHFRKDGTLVDNLFTNRNGLNMGGGLCFDGAGNLYSTNSDDGTTSKFDNAGNLLASSWAGPYSGFPSSCVRDASNHIYVSEVGGLNKIQKFDPEGTLIKSWTPTVETDGISWIDLDADQCTMFYTTNNKIKRFDICSNTQLSDFAGGFNGTCSALRIRSNSEVMATCAGQVHRLDASGVVMQSYTAASLGFNRTVTNPNFLRYLGLDPDGTSFWVGGYFHNSVGQGSESYKVDIASGNPLLKLPFAKENLYHSIAIFGEPTQGSHVPTSFTATPDTLWPPNNKLKPVTIQAVGNGLSQCQINSVSSNQLITSSDYKITGNLSLLLRASRSGKGKLRVYTIDVSCVDAQAQIVNGNVTVTVPHHQGNKEKHEHENSEENEHKG